MDREQRLKQSAEMKAFHQSNHLSNLRIFHGWLGKVFFNHGAPHQSRDKILQRIDQKNRSPIK